MDIIIKTTGIVLISVALAVLVRQYVPSLSPIFAILAVGTCALFILPLLSQGLSGFSDIMAKLGLNSTFFTVIKVLIVTTLGKVMAELCRDNGEKALGLTSELLGAAAGIICAMPLFTQVLKTLGGGF